jgi:hypothetical protein
MTRFSRPLAHLAVLAAMVMSTLIVTSSPALAAEFAPCNVSGPSAADGTTANQLNSRLQANLRGAMTAYRVSCARKVVDAVKARGLPVRAAVIAITTTIVESGIQNYSVAVDLDSLGLFQQRGFWGSPGQRTDPAWATNAFLNSMLDKFPNNSWMTTQIGVVCQEIQGSDFPERYQPQAGDGQIIVDALWTATPVYHSFAVGDLDNDGKNDVTGRAQSGDVNFHKNVGGGNGITWGDGWKIMNATDYVQIEIGDLNNDGKNDLIGRAQNGDIFFHPNVGGGNGITWGTGCKILTNPGY